MKQTKIFTYGRHALSEALKYAPQAITKVYLDPRLADTKLRRQVEAQKIPTAPLSEGMARSDMKSGTPHQGIVGQISLHTLLVPYEKFLNTLSITPRTSLVLLCGIQDPHNVGAIIRSAVGFGAAGILMPEVGQAPISGAVIKVSAGSAFRVPLVRVLGIVEAITDLRKRGFAAYALEAHGTPIGEEAFSKPALFILGNEGHGIPAEIRRLCDATLAIPLDPRLESLNVAAAAAVALYARAAKVGQA